MKQNKGYFMWGNMSEQRKSAIIGAIVGSILTVFLINLPSVFSKIKTIPSYQINRMQSDIISLISSIDQSYDYDRLYREHSYKYEHLKDSFDSIRLQIPNKYQKLRIFHQIENKLNRLEIRHLNDTRLQNGIDLKKAKEEFISLFNQLN